MVGISTRGRAAVAVVAAASALVALVGCSGGGGATSGGKPALTQFYHQYGEDGVEAAVKQWAADDKDAAIDVQWVTGDYNQKITALLLAGKGIDIYENNAIDVQSARQGKYADMTDIIAPIVDKLSPISLKPVTIDGKYYGVPMITDAQVFLYRKSMFTEAGITAPPTTWDQFVEDVKKTTTDSHKGLFIGNDGGAGVVGTMAPVAAGTNLLNDDNTKITFDSDGLAQALTDIQGLYKNGNLLTGAATDWWDPTSFIAGDAAITWQGLWAVPKITEALGDDVGVFAMPAIGSTGTGAVAVSQWNMQVAASSSDVDAAKAVVTAQWIDDTAWQQKFSVGFGFHIPPISATAASTEKLQSGLPKDIVDLTTKYGYSAGPFWTPAMATALTDAASHVILDGADATSELATAQSTAQGLLDALNK